MGSKPCSSNNPDTPFPKAKRSKALCEEGEFMEEHGGIGARITFLIVEGVAEIVSFPLRVLRMRRLHIRTRRFHLRKDFE